MKKFLAIYQASPELLAKWTAAPAANKNDEMAKWQAWMHQHQSSIIDEGNPVGQNLKVTSAGVSQVRNGICGYTIVTADSAEAAAAMFADNPHVMESDAWIDIMPIVDMSS